MATEYNDEHRIVVGVDGSDSSIAALRYAASLAAVLDSPVEAVMAWSHPVYVEPYLLREWSARDSAIEELDRATYSAFGDSPPQRLTKTVLEGPPARRLIEISKNSAMLVLGSRGHGGFVGMLLGSVSSACAHHAHCPVLIVRGEKELLSGEESLLSAQQSSDAERA